MFGCQVFFKWKENSAWFQKADYEQIKRLIHKCKVCQRNTSAFTEEFHKDNSEKERKVDDNEKLLANENTSGKMEDRSVKEIEKAFLIKKVKLV